MSFKRLRLFLMLFVLLILLVSTIVSAKTSKDITFSLSQKDYYFKTGENAILSLNISNTYGHQVNGMLTYVYSQEINQGGMHMTSSNSQSVSLTVDNGDSVQGLNFGTSNNPSILHVDLKFSYTEDESRIINLNGVVIHFVSDDSQKQNEQNQQTSSSQKQQASQQNSQQQDPFAQMQQQINKMMGINQPSQSQNQNSQQALQNSQMPQDSSALKKQMQDQLKQQQEMKDEFQKQLASNKDFQKEHQEMINKGFNLTSADVNPTSNNTGDFKLNYEKSNGEQASLQGMMNNGSMQNIRKDTPETREAMKKSLEENPDFKKYEDELKKQGYERKDISMTQEENKTNVQVNYLNKNNETATISAEMENNTVDKVELNLNNVSKTNNFWTWLILVVIGVLIYFIYVKRKKKVLAKPSVEKKPKKPFDYLKESNKLIAEGKDLFENKEFKDAYGKIGQAIRLYLSYKYKLEKEITSDELLSFLRKNNKTIPGLNDCFDTCSLVEFAKYKANKTDFDKIVKTAEKIVN